MLVVTAIAEVTQPSRAERRWLIALLVLAALLRLGLIAWKPESLAEDRDLYWGLAKRVAAGEGYVHPDLGHPTAYRPPLYPLLLAGIVVVGGGAKWLGAVQIGLAVGATLWTWRLGRTLCDARTGMIAAGLVTFNPLLIQTTTLAMTETLCSCLLVLWLLLWSERSRNAKRATWPLGLVAGAAVLCRPTVWVFVGLSSVVIAVAEWRRQGASRAERLREMARVWSPAMAAFALTVAPWGIRNQWRFGQPIVTTTHGGYTLLLGNNDEVYRAEVLDANPAWDSRGWQEALRRERQRSGLEARDEVAVDRWLSHTARDWIRQHPREFCELCWLRVKRFWNLIPGGADAGSLPTIVRWGIAVFFAVELWAAAIGLWRLRREEWRAWWPLVLLLLSFALVHVVYWSNLRMRAPVEPVLALLAARAFVHRRDRREGSSSMSHDR